MVIPVHLLEYAIIPRENLFAPSYVMVIIILLRCVQSQEQEVVNGVMVNV